MIRQVLLRNSNNLSSSYGSLPDNESDPSANKYLDLSVSRSPPYATKTKKQSEDENETYVLHIEADNSQDENNSDEENSDEENSPYAEVRAAVPITDENIKINHWRTWVLTIGFVTMFSGINQFFSLRYPTLSIGFIVAQLVSFPIGSFLHIFLPEWNPFPKYLQQKYPNFTSWFDLNPGPFSIKEHAIITIAVSLTSSSAYAMGVLLTQTNFYKKEYTFFYEIMLVVTTQMLGYGLAGLTRRWIVYPAAMIWPETLVSTTLFTTIHENRTNKPANGWFISRYRFFACATALSFIWFWVPGFLFTGLSYFSFICWIFPQNKIVNQLFGFNTGLGIIPITFDWTQVTQAGGSPLATPWWVTANIIGSVIFFFWILVPILYYSNTWYSKYLPILSAATFDNKGKAYDIGRILTNELSFDAKAYKEYSPLLIPFSYIMSYALNFAAVGAIFVHSFLYNGKDIYHKLLDASNGGEDIHRKIMKKYKEVPDLWYLILFFTVVSFSAYLILSYETQLPLWGLFLSISIAAVNFIPQGLMEGITNQHVGLNIITELIAGYIFPGKPFANLMVKIYGFIPMRHGLDFSRDLKLAQYMKVPPVLLFWIQIVSTLIAALVNVTVQRWMRLNIKDLCSPHQENGFTCAGGRTMFNASIIWGVVGPHRMFSKGAMYSPIMWFFLIGALAPIFTFYLHKRWPHKWFGNLNAPVFFAGPGNIPPATGANYGAFALVGLFFNFIIKKRWGSWWKKYNYILSGSMDTGVAIATIAIFITVTYPGGNISWWGNRVWKNTLDYKSTSYYSLKDGETFGPSKW